MSKLKLVMSEGDKKDFEKEVDANFEDKHPRDADGKFTSGNESNGSDDKERHDTSTEKAKDLKISDWGTPEEVEEMASPIRNANNRAEALEILKGIRKNGPLENKSIPNLMATISSDSMNKMVSDVALHKSYDRKAHWQAVANVDKLFFNAKEPWEFEVNSTKNNQDLKARRILYSPMKFGIDIVPVKLTVKEFKDASRGTRLYSVEAIDVEIKK